MSEPRAMEIMVNTPMQEWSDEMVAQWNILADTVTRAVRQQTKLTRDEEQRELARRDEELRRLQSALEASEQRAMVAAHDAAERLNAMQRQYDSKIASLERERQHGKHAAQPEIVSPEPPAGRTPRPANEAQIAEFARHEWERDSSSAGKGIAWAAEQWSRLREGPLFLPVTGFLSGLLIMVLVYPFLRHAPVRAANSGAVKTLAAVAKRPADAVSSPAKGANPESLSLAASAKPSAVVVTGDTSRAGKPQASVNGAGTDKYAVLLAGGKTLTATRQGEPSAEYEARLAMHAGYTRTAIYQKNGRYMVAVLYSNQDQAREGINAVNAPYGGRWKRTSSVVSVEQWCADRKAMSPIIINGADLAVWSCGKGPG